MCAAAAPEEGRGMDGPEKTLEKTSAEEVTNTEKCDELLSSKKRALDEANETDENPQQKRAKTAEPTVFAEVMEEPEDDAEATGVTISDWDLASNMTLRRGGLTVEAGESAGYTSARASHGARSGTWYYECSPASRGSHYRVGFAQKHTDVECPVGVDAWSFAYCDKTGAASSNAARKPYGDTFEKDDVVGCLINLDASEISFFNNGRPQGVAFAQLPRGPFYPAVSVFDRGTVHLNFGPNFVFPPELEATPFSALADLKKDLACFQADPDVRGDAPGPKKRVTVVTDDFKARKDAGGGGSADDSDSDSDSSSSAVQDNAGLGSHVSYSRAPVPAVPAFARQQWRHR